jgi:exodeoxyribonuclease V beta subunit
VLQRWLSTVMATRLPGPEVSLHELGRQGRLLPEMEFWLPAGRLSAARVDALCSTHLLPGLARPELPPRELHGMLMGFADLVFEHQGRYWVLDYKSNQLGADGWSYTAEAMARAVAEHRYEVQATLYLLALHRLLRVRLGAAYRPAQQLGGALVLFLRGIDGPAQGVCQLAPPLALIEALDAMLGSTPAAAPEAAC